MHNIYPVILDGGEILYTTKKKQRRLIRGTQKRPNRGTNPSPKQ